MRIDTRYVCEVCAGTYRTPAEATACEARGGPAPLYPPGMIFQLTQQGPKVYALLGEHPASTVHARSYIGVEAGGSEFAASWERLPSNPVVRRAYAPLDSTYFPPNGPPRIHPPDPTHPAFAALVRMLICIEVTPTVWDGATCVPCRRLVTRVLTTLTDPTEVS